MYAPHFNSLKNIQKNVPIKAPKHADRYKDYFSIALGSDLYHFRRKRFRILS